jgi:hypothetical protein
MTARMAFVQCWYSRDIKRGASVTVDGERARVLSARDGLVFVRMWTTGERVAVKPAELVSA